MCQNLIKCHISFVSITRLFDYQPILRLTQGHRARPPRPGERDRRPRPRPPPRGHREELEPADGAIPGEGPDDPGGDRQAGEAAEAGREGGGRGGIKLVT